jgi:hydrogenase expression/formation protein HypE
MSIEYTVMNESTAWGTSCPVPITADSQRITLAHGEGARLTRRLITEIILPRFTSTRKHTHQMSDAARVTTVGCRLAVCADGHTVSPMFFPGGNLGSLSVFGTVNDLVVSGAHARWLTMSMIIEEGLPTAVLEQILDSAASAAEMCGVTIVAGDTKVVPRGHADGLFLTTSGIGEMLEPIPPGPQTIKTGDQILVSGPIGQHGIAVLCVRNGLLFDPLPQSDSRPVIREVTALRNAVGEQIRTIRDATRGGVSAVLQEWAQECSLTFNLRESRIPVSPEVRGASELLGLDPLYVACEGTIVAAVAAESAEIALAALRQIPGCEQSAIIGEVGPREICAVTIQRTLGRPQPLDEPAGAMLPRIC